MGAAIQYGERWSDEIQVGLNRVSSTPEIEKVLPLDKIYLTWAIRYLTTPIGEHWECEPSAAIESGRVARPLRSAA